MANTSHIHVRSLEIGDFSFVQSLAAKQPTFTVPPTYVLWLMLRIKGAVRLVAEHSTAGPLAYLLAVPVNNPAESLFIWQLAASEGRQQRAATLALLTELRETVMALGVDKLIFSSIPNSPAYRLIRHYALKLGSARPKQINALPPSVSKIESEFSLELSELRDVEAGGRVS